MIAESPGEASASEIAAQESDFFKSVASVAGGSYANVQGPTVVTVGGLEWRQETADITYKGAALRAEVFATDHAGTLYFMGCVTTKGEFVTTDAQVYQPVLHSFYFTLQ